MNSSTLTALLLILVTFHGLHGASLAATPLEDLCSSLGGFYVTPELCTSTLCADPACRTADVPGLALIAAKLALASATAVKSNIEASLAHGAPGQEAKKAFQDCLQLYVGAVPSLQWAASSVAARRYAGPREVVDMARRIAPGCTGMAGSNLSKETSGYDTTTIVAHAVLAALSP